MKDRKINEGYSCISKSCRKLENPITKGKRWSQNIKFAIQRVKYGYCESDIWEIDTWFLKTVPCMLRYLKSTAMGFPSKLGNEDNTVLCLTEEECQEGYRKWQGILTEMIELFDNADIRNAPIDEMDQRESNKNQAFFLFSKWFYDLWD